MKIFKIQKLTKYLNRYDITIEKLEYEIMDFGDGNSSELTVYVSSDSLNESFPITFNYVSDSVLFINVDGLFNFHHYTGWFLTHRNMSNIIRICFDGIQRHLKDKGGSSDE